MSNGGPWNLKLTLKESGLWIKIKAQNFASQVLNKHTFKIWRKKGSGFFDHRGTLSLAVSRWLFCRRRQRNGQKWKTHVQGVQSSFFCPLNMQICDVLVAVGVKFPIEFTATASSWPKLAFCQKLKKAWLTLAHFLPVSYRINQLLTIEKRVRRRQLSCFCVKKKPTVSSERLRHDIGPKIIHSAPLEAALRSMSDVGVQDHSQMWFAVSRLLMMEENWVPGEKPSSRVEIDWNSVHT